MPPTKTIYQVFGLGIDLARDQRPEWAPYLAHAEEPRQDSEPALSALYRELFQVQCRALPLG